MSNGPVVPLLRPTLWAVTYQEWKDDAACNGMPVELFELGDAPHSDEQHELIATGLRVCTSCPVRQECKANSNEDDRRWTTRGGQPPEGLFPKPTAPRVGTPKEVCDWGHSEWVVVGKYGKRRCKTCHNERSNKARKAKARAMLG